MRLARARARAVAAAGGRNPGPAARRRAAAAEAARRTAPAGRSTAPAAVGGTAAASGPSPATPPALGPDGSPAALAFLGDAVWTLYVRRHFLVPPKHFRLFHDAARPLVTAEGQAAVYDRLMAGGQPQQRQQSGGGGGGGGGGEHGPPLLEPDEAALLASAAGWAGQRLRQRFATPRAAQAYRKATALEALVGHLHLTNPARLEQLMEALLPPPLPSAPTPPTPALSAELDNGTAGSGDGRQDAGAGRW